MRDDFSWFLCIIYGQKGSDISDIIEIGGIACSKPTEPVDILV